MHHFNPFNIINKLFIPLFKFYAVLSDLKIENLKKLTVNSF